MLVWLARHYGGKLCFWNGVDIQAIGLSPEAPETQYQAFMAMAIPRSVV